MQSAFGRATKQLRPAADRRQLITSPFLRNLRGRAFASRDMLPAMRPYCSEERRFGKSVGVLRIENDRIFDVSTTGASLNAARLTLTGGNITGKKGCQEPNY